MTIKRPLILITNDDGIDSPGLHAVVKAIADLGELLIMAPSTQQTGAGRSYPTTADKTVIKTQIPLQDGPLPAHKAKVSPAQAVALAIRELAERPIDLCISGINFGENVGSGITISGTVGAAIEAACFGIPSLAMSLQTPVEYHLHHSDSVDFSTAAYFTRYFAARALERGLPDGVDLLKIDVPADATPETPWRAARISRQRYYQAPVTSDKADRVVNRFIYEPYVDTERVEPDSDIYALAIDKIIAVTPMTIDLTAPIKMEAFSSFYA
ncbi:MAG: 5'/3'-nucleotidase SurE [Anaerolineae bacterium]|nr:5'/3'-nucleotidase SurE [Anaerolineae bacterium]